MDDLALWHVKNITDRHLYVELTLVNNFYHV